MTRAVDESILVVGGAYNAMETSEDTDIAEVPVTESDEQVGQSVTIPEFSKHLFHTTEIMVKWDAIIIP